MRPPARLHISLLALAAFMSPTSYMQTAEGETGKTTAELALCDALQAVGPGDRMTVKVSGVYKSGFEMSMLFDPDQRLCRLDVQPSTWVEFASMVISESPREYEILQRTTEAIRSAVVTFEGELWGPKAVGEDDPTAPVMIAYANRVANRRYGHNNAFRTKLVVHTIHFVKNVRNSDYETGARHRPKDHGPFSAIVEGKIPVYPSRAQLAGIEGQVIVNVEVENGAVVHSTVLKGDRILTPDTLANIETWQFEPDVSTSFVTMFIYQLELRATDQPHYSRVTMELPEKVTIIGALNGW